MEPEVYDIPTEIKQQVMQCQDAPIEDRFMALAALSKYGPGFNIEFLHAATDSDKAELILRRDLIAQAVADAGQEMKDKYGWV